MKKILLFTLMIFSGLDFINAQPVTLDPSFGTNGIVTAASTFAFSSFALQKDGKIVVSGTAEKSENIITYFLARYNTDGSLDNTFSEDGTQWNEFDITSVTIEDDQKIVAAKPIDSGYVFARYNIDGSIDKTFGEDGKLTINFGAIVFPPASNKVLFAIQKDGKIVVTAKALEENNFIFLMARYNSDGSLDNTFRLDPKITFKDLYYANGYPSSIGIQSNGKIVISGTFITFHESYFTLAIFDINGDLATLRRSQFVEDLDEQVSSSAIQDDDKIVLAGTDNERAIKIARYTAEGDLDSTFSEDGVQIDYLFGFDKTDSIAIQIRDDKKIVLLVHHDANKSTLFSYSANGSFDSTFSIAGIEKTFSVNHIAISDNKLYTLREDKLARYLLNEQANTPPTVTLTTPTNNTTRLAPAAHIKLSAVVADKDGTISKVEFYNGTHLLHTETVIPYGFVWRNVGLGNYTLTAKAYDNDGLVTTSAPVHISVVPNKPPVVKIINPKNNETFAASASIQIEADAKDLDGRMARVEFYNGSTLLNTQYQLPYRFVWKDVPAGTYTITAVARDNWGARTTSAPVTFAVKSNTTIVSSRASVNSIDKVNAASITLSPNPANTIVNLNTTGLQQDKPTTIRVLSASGVVMKTMHLNSSAKTIQLDVSSLVKGVYTIQLASDKKVLYKQFVKL